jgi:CheY-like chemotaxis protein
MYAEYLSHVGSTPVCVQEATDALRLASRVDVVVTGILLPGPLDGCGLIAALKRNAATRRIPIVVLTACAWTHEDTGSRCRLRRVLAEAMPATNAAC